MMESRPPIKSQLTSDRNAPAHDVAHFNTLTSLSLTSSIGDGDEEMYIDRKVVIKETFAHVALSFARDLANVRSPAIVVFLFCLLFFANESTLPARCILDRWSQTYSP